MPKLSIRDLDLTDKRVLIRVDFNVPSQGWHHHRRHPHPRDPPHHRVRPPPQGQGHPLLAPRPPQGQAVATMSLRPIVDHLRHLLDHILGDDENVAFSPDCIGAVASEMAANLESRAKPSCSKTSASTPKKRPTTPPSRNNSPGSATSTCQRCSRCCLSRVCVTLT